MSEMSISDFWQSCQIPPITIQPPPPSHLKRVLNKVFPFIDHMPKTWIDGLPADMMTKIIRYQRQKDLPAVALTCKAFSVYVRAILLNQAEAIFQIGQENKLFETFGVCYEKPLVKIKDAYELLAGAKKLLWECRTILHEEYDHTGSAYSVLKNGTELKSTFEQAEKFVFESRFGLFPYLPKNTSLERKAAIIQEVFVTYSRYEYLIASRFPYRLYFIPRQIYHLTSLRVLNLRAGLFSRISSDVRYLTDLEELYLSENMFTVFPLAIVRLRRLQVLDLSWNQMKKIPSKIELLIDLRKLNLSHNELSSLPPAIGRLRALQELDVSCNYLLSTPPEIGELTALQRLNLFANGRKQLFSLSSSIGYLAALEELDVGCCALRSVPPEIGQCGVLRKLHLRGNSIEELPSEVNALTALEELDVARNPLSTLLPHMDTLINLRLLVLNETNLSQAAVDEIMQLAPPGCLIYWATSWRQSR